jgi:hypothetical protein
MEKHLHVAPCDPFVEVRWNLPGTLGRHIDGSKIQRFVTHVA